MSIAANVHAWFAPICCALLIQIKEAAPPLSEYTFNFAIARPLVNDGKFNRRVVGAVIAVVVIAVLTAYVLAQVYRTSSGHPTQSSTGTISLMNRSAAADCSFEGPLSSLTNRPTSKNAPICASVPALTLNLLNARI